MMNCNTSELTLIMSINYLECLNFSVRHLLSLYFETDNLDTKIN